MTISQAVQLISEYCENDLPKTRAVLKHDCAIENNKINELYDMNDPMVGFGDYIPYFAGRGHDYILELLKYFNSEEKKQLINYAKHLENLKINQKTDSIIPDKDISKSENISENKKESSSIIIINDDDNNSADAKINNESTTNISTLIDLNIQVQASDSIRVENKIEIQNMISQLENAKDNNDEGSYVDLFFKLLDKLSGTGLIPDWLAKSAKFAQNFLDK